MPDFTPEAIRDALTVAGYRERNPDLSMTGYQVGDARETLGEIIIEPRVALADPPYITEEERRSQGKLMLGCLLALRLAGYTATAASSTMIVVTEDSHGRPSAHSDSGGQS
jgi:hypothetical protein